MKTTLLFCMLAILICGCEKKLSEPTTITANNPEAPTDTLSAIALRAYKLPDSDDFNAIPQDPRNPLTADKVALGKLLFHETRLGTTNLDPQGLHTYSCATCHHAEAGFQSGLAQAIGEGGVGFGATGEGRKANPLYAIGLIDVAPLRTPSVLNTAYQEVMMWSGQFGGTGVNKGTEASWTPGTPKYNNSYGYQGLETTGLSAETRHRLVPDTAWLASSPVYKHLFNAAFNELPVKERISNLTVALAIAAFERTVLPNQSPFQQWLRGDNNAMTKDEQDGKAIFFGKGNCSSCHSGPGLNAMAFYSLGFSDLADGVGGAFNVPDRATEFLGRGGFTNKKADMFKFKTPQLYNLKDVKYLGHGSSFTSVTDVIRYINNAVPQNKNVPASQLAEQFKPLNLTETEINKLTIFVENALYDPSLSRYVPEALPSGNCIPNNDAQSKKDRGL